MTWKYAEKERQKKPKRWKRAITGWEGVSPQLRRAVLTTRALAFGALLWLASEFSLHCMLYLHFEGIPSLEEIRTTRPFLSTILYDRNGEEFARFFLEDRVEVPLSEISPWLPKAVVAAEDTRFHAHHGIRLLSILRAAVENRRAGAIRQGGSTITQQLARNLFLSHERTMERKLREAIIAFRLEYLFSKEEILERYLNSIYFGCGAWGVEVASNVYFGKSASALSLGEACLLAGLIPSPNRLNPAASPEAAEAGKRRVLARVSGLWPVSEEERTAAEKPVKVVPEPRNLPSDRVRFPYFAERVLFGKLIPEFGIEGAYGGGLRVFTTLDPRIQSEGEKIAAGSKQQLALVGMDPETGEVLALVGGKDWKESPFNRATQAYRQPGSAFKPLVYAALFEERGWTPETRVQDSPISFGSGRSRWSPKNYDGGFRGTLTVRTALARSINVPAVRAFATLGVENGMDFFRKLGITTPHLPENLTAALGSASVTPLEMLVAFSVFANGGHRVEPALIRAIGFSDGTPLRILHPVKKKVVSERTAAAIRSILVDAVRAGTGRAAIVPGVEVFGKTGTTNSYIDAWFVGGIPGFTAAVYVGNDDRKPLGRRATGGVVAAPLWKEFAAAAKTSLALEGGFALPKEELVARSIPRPSPPRVGVPQEEAAPAAAAPVEVAPAPPPPEKPAEERDIKPAEPLPPMLDEDSFSGFSDGEDLRTPDVETEQRYRELLRMYNIDESRTEGATP